MKSRRVAELLGRLVRLPRRRSLATVSVLVALTAAVGVGSAFADDPSATPSADSTEKIVLQIGWNQNLDSLNPFIGYQNVSYAVYGENYDYLLRYGPNPPIRGRGWPKAGSSPTMA